MYSATTHRIRVTAQPAYSAERSDPERGRWFWTYSITIENQSERDVQLLARHWDIIDGTGRRETVEGPGVVGEQPIIAPGATYTYTSGCPLKTDSGLMSGRYRMVGPDGTAFEVAIPAFSLDLPEPKRRMN